MDDSVIEFSDDPTLTIRALPDPTDFTVFHPFIKGVFSQWHHTPFTVDGRDFVCAEQYMMAAKASLFGDERAFEAIMNSDDPAVQKRLGSTVSGFSEDRWTLWRLDIVFTASRAKFGQNSGALRQLRNTAPAMLVEANPRDWNWGNGLQLDDPANHDPSRWRGTNYLGRILTLIRADH
ncbi:MAG: NADAR family protein [Pseudomonadota bacterium]